MKQNVNKTIASLWAKTSISRTIKWHPLFLHMLDLAVSADAILAREPETTRNRMAVILEMEWAAARPWLLIVIACHDLGKACPGFQCKWQNMTGIDAGRSPCTDINHAFVSQIALEELLQEKGWSYELAELTAGAVGCHHGERPSPSNLDRLGVNRKALGNPAWTQARRDLFDALMGVLEPSGYPIASTLSGPDFMLLAGLTSFSDWIGSNEEFFPYGTIKDCNNLHDWFQNRSSNAEKVLETIGWRLRTALSKEQKSFSQVFDMSPRPLQQAVEDVLAMYLRRNTKRKDGADYDCWTLVESVRTAPSTGCCCHWQASRA